MYVSTLGIEEWVGGNDIGPNIENPQWVQIEDAIRRLDGRSRTLVTLIAEGGGHMVVGGGERGEYLGYATFDNQTFFNVIVHLHNRQGGEVC